jgi:hypothetical protein
MSTGFLSAAQRRNDTAFALAMSCHSGGADPIPALRNGELFQENSWFEDESDSRALQVYLAMSRALLQANFWISGQFLASAPH